MKIPDEFKFMLDCKKCSLCESRTHVVVGEGSQKAKLMFVGEAPGAEEDYKRRPFVGMSGKKMRDVMVSVGLSPSDVYITNSVKCRPPANRRPYSDELEACLGHLRLQIRWLNPELICCVGGTPLNLFCPNEKIMSVHGKLQMSKKFHRMIFPIIHPAAVLRRPSVEKEFREDFEKLKAIVDGKSTNTIQFGMRST